MNIYSQKSKITRLFTKLVVLFVILSQVGIPSVLASALETSTEEAVIYSDTHYSDQLKSNSDLDTLVDPATKQDQYSDTPIDSDPVPENSNSGRGSIITETDREVSEGGSISLPNPEAPKTASDIKTSLGQVNQNTGAFTYEYPMSFPLARGKNQPMVTISYNSQRVRNYETLISRGWNFSAPYIERVNMRGVDKLYTDNTFSSSLYGNIIPVLPTIYGTNQNYLDSVSQNGYGLYATEIEHGEYTQFEFKENPNGSAGQGMWFVTDKSGTRYEYGTEESSIEYNPNTHSHISKWFLTAIIDSNGNTIRYTYSHSGNISLLETIEYPGTIISFNYNNAEFPRVFYNTGYERVFTKQLQEVIISTIDDSGQLQQYRKYALSYDNGNLSNITEQYSENGIWNSLPATKFGYKQSLKGWVYDPSYPIDIEEESMPNGSWNSDAYPDMFGVKKATNNNQIIAKYIIDTNIVTLPDWSTKNGINGWGDKNWEFLVGNNNIQKGTLIDWDGDMDSDIFGSSSNGTYSKAGYILKNEGIEQGFVIDTNMLFEGIAPTAGSTQIMDWNADGLPDIVCAEETTKNVYWFLSNCSYGNDFDRFLINTGARFEEKDYHFPVQSTVQYPTFLSQIKYSFRLYYDNPNDFSSGGVGTLDMNADGLTDLYTTYNNYQSGKLQYAVLNDGNNFSEKIIAQNVTGGGSKVVSNWFGRTADINSDGFMDFVCRSNYAVTKVYSFYPMNNKPCATANPYAEITTTHGVYAYNNSKALAVRDESAQWQWPDRDQNEPVAKPNSSISEDPKELFQLTFGGTNGNDGYWVDTGLQFIDINADGYPDLVRPSKVIDYGYTKTPSRVYINQNYGDGWLDTITVPTGGKVSVKYAPAVSYRDENGNLANPLLPVVIDTVQTLSIDDGFGNIGTGGAPATTEYWYAGGTWNYKGPHQRGFSGFEIVRIVNPDLSIATHWYHLGNEENAQYEQDDIPALAGMIWKTEIKNKNGNIMKQELYRYVSEQLQDRVEFRAPYKENDISNYRVTAYFTRYFSAPQSILSRVYDGNDTLTVQTAVGYEYDIPTGTIKKSIDYGYVATPLLQKIFGWDSDGTFNDIWSDKRVTQYEYAYDSVSPVNNQFFGQHTRIAKETLIGGNGNTVTWNSVYYDDLPFGELSNGNETKNIQYIRTGSQGDITATTTAEYDTYGNIVTITDALGNKSFVEYDNNVHQYPTIITNQIGHKTLNSYNYLCGAISKQIMPNGAIMNYDFDTLCRVITTRSTDQNGVLVTLSENQYNDVPNNYNIKQTQYSDANTSTYSKQYIDGLGRSVSSVHPINDGSLFAYSGSVYGYNGQVSQALLPVTVGTDSFIPLQGLINQNTGLVYETEYDALGRVVSVTNSSGTVTTEYNGLNKTVTDQLGNKKRYRSNTFGELVSVSEFNTVNNNIEEYSTNYNRDERGLLVSIIDAENNRRDFEYDGRGLLIKKTDLHNLNDVTYGIWRFVYDSNGNMRAKVNPDSSVLIYSYDRIGRVVTISEYKLSSPKQSTPDQDTPPKTAQPKPKIQTKIKQIYTYDICQRGQLCSVKTNGSSTTYEYYPNALVSKQTITTSLGSESSEYSYDRQGRVRITTQSGSTVNNSYNHSGLSKQQSGLVSTAVLYTANGSIHTIEKDSGHIQKFTYDSAHQNRLQDIQFVIPGSDTTDIQYTYNDAGMITHIATTSGTKSRIESYEYDDLYRLTIASVNGVVTDVYRYSPIGNILEHNADVYEYNDSGFNEYANPMAVTRVGSTDIVYNRNGEIISLGMDALQWNVLGQLTEYRQGGNKYTYTYDHTGNRITQTNFINGKQSTVFTPNDSITIKSQSGVITKKLGLSIAGRQTTTITDDTDTEHLFTNHLLSIIQTAGSTQSNIIYSPYGEVRESTDSVETTRGYIGEETDTTGLSYLNARYYNTSIGRFISQDPASRDNPEQFVNDPQQLNLYSYARNNPVMYNDPTGEFIQALLIGIFTPTELYDDSAEFKPEATYASDRERMVVETVNSVSAATIASVNPGNLVSGVAGKLPALRKGAKILSHAETPGTLTHYTNEAGYNGIMKSMKMKPSVLKPGMGDVAYGDGVYLTNLDTRIADKETIEYAIYNNQRSINGDIYYIQLKTKGLPVAQHEISGNYHIPTKKPISIQGRIINHGKVK